MHNENSQKHSLENTEVPDSKRINIDSSKDGTLETPKKIVNAEHEPVKYFNGVEISKLTKRQMKKYKKCLKWQEVKKEKRAKEKLRMKERRHEAKLNNIDLGPSRKELKKKKMKDSPCKIGVCIDLSFDELMIDKVLIISIIHTRVGSETVAFRIWPKR